MVEAVTTKHALVVVFNGVTQEVPFEKDELVRAILQRAIQAYGITQQPHLYSLFSAEDGTALREDVSAHDAGLRNKSKVYLRQDQIKGGGR